MGTYTHIFVYDTRKNPPTEFHYERYNFLPEGTKLEKYFAEEGVYDYESFKKWLTAAKFEKGTLAGPFKRLWEQYWIIVTIGPRNSFTMSTPVLGKLEFENPNKEKESYSKPIGGSGRPQIELGGYGRSKKDLNHYVLALRQQGYSEDEIEQKVPGYKQYMYL